ncbi:MAG: OmpA family protein [Chitinophagales bacterium]
MVTAQSKKAGRYYNSAMHYKAIKHPDKACKKLTKAIRKDPSSPDAYSLLGRWYFEAHRFAEAADVFKRASARCPNGASRFAKPYTKSLLYAGHPDPALQLINTYGTIKDSAEWNKMRAQAYFIKQAMSNPTSAQPVNLGMRINSPVPELFPSMAADTGTLYFTRRVNNMDDDLYYARADSCGGWFAALNMGSLPNTPDYEQAQFISADGHYLFFTRCDNRSDDGWAEGGCDLFMAYRIARDSDWTIPQPFGSTINTIAYEGMPSLSPDNRELYFVSDREGGYGGYDIWISHLEDGIWQLPVNAGPNVNTPGNETAPYINFDNKALYFTSDGWPGMGGSDIFMSKKTGDTTWSKTINLGYPINTAYDEKSECITLDGKTLYFSSDRNGPAGNYDIYETPLPGNLRPIPVSYIAGIVYDSLTHERLNYSAMFICNAATGDTIYHFYSNRGDGSYLITLHVDNTYIMHIAHIGYTEIADTITFDNLTALPTGQAGGKHVQYLQEPLVHNIPMLPSNYDEIRPINDSLIAVIHYDVNRVELSPAEKATIRDAIAPWLAQGGYIISVNAYTDNTGTPMINEELSHKRAALVAKQVMSIGVDETMVRAKGWGEAKMIAPNDTEEGQRKNRRVEIIIKR